MVREIMYDISILSYDDDIGQSICEICGKENNNIQNFIYKGIHEININLCDECIKIANSPFITSHQYFYYNEYMRIIKHREREYFITEINNLKKNKLKRSLTF
jgi:hypothetical protein